MEAPRRTKVGVRQQALLVFTLSAFWYFVFGLSLRAGGYGVINSFGVFGVVVFFSLPFILPVLAGLLIISHVRVGRLYRAWVYSAVIVAVSPWFWYVLIRNS